MYLMIYIVKQRLVAIDAVVSADMLLRLSNLHDAQPTIEPVVRKHEVIHETGST